MKRIIVLAFVAILLLGLTTLGSMNQPAPTTRLASPDSTGTLFKPTVAEWEFLAAGATPPTEAQCYSAGRRCFAPAAMANSYNYATLHALGNQGQGKTIAVIDSWGSDSMPHDLHVFNQAFGLQAM